MFMKIINNDAYKFYNFLIKGYEEGDLSKGFDSSENNLFVHGAIGLASLKISNLLPDGDVIAGYLFKMHRCYGAWQSGRIDAKVNRRRMLRAAAE